MEATTNLEKLAHLKSKFPENYQVESFLGEGGFGLVIQCFKKDTGETVAVKVPVPGVSLKNEFTTLSVFKSAQLDKYNIIKFIEAFTLKDNRVALACEKLDMTLIDYIIKHGRFTPLDLHEVRSIIQQMAMALEALESRGIIHSDIKGDNIMLVDCEVKPISVKLIDFGLAFPTSRARRGTLYQTEMYRAPEIHLGLPVSEAIDMWSLGIIMSSMVLGYSINQGRSRFDKIRRLVDLLGMPPDHLLNDGWYTKRYFTKTTSGNWRLKTPAEYWGDCEYEEDMYYPFHSLDELETLSLPNLDAVEAEEKKECIDLLKAMLRLDPAERITPTGVLNHPFIRRGRVEHSSDDEKPGTSKPEEPEEPEEPGANKTEDQGTNQADESKDTCDEKPGTSKPEEPEEPEEPGANETEDQGTNQADESKDTCLSDICGSTSTPAPRVVLVQPAPPDCCYNLEEDNKKQSKSCSSDSHGFYGPTKTPFQHFILVKPAPPDRCHKLYEDDEEQSESGSETTTEDTSENSSAEYPRKDECFCPVGLFFAKGCNSELTPTTADDTDTEKKTTKKKKKKNCIKRFFRWIKKTFCSCVSANDQD